MGIEEQGPAQVITVPASAQVIVKTVQVQTIARLAVIKAVSVIAVHHQHDDGKHVMLNKHSESIASNTKSPTDCIIQSKILQA
jgi:hypothetical protein